MSPTARYLVPARRHRVEEVIQRSRFITTVRRCESARCAHLFVDELRGEFPDATHHCWAFVAGPPGSTQTVGMSDDGEPHGTAGRPMLTALLHSEVGEIAAVCTRYFGGKKLGTGGLSRAYSGGVKRALEALPTEERVDRVGRIVRVEYPQVDAVLRLFEALEVQPVSEEYGEGVRYRVQVPLDHLDELSDRLADLTAGAGRVETE